ncbi:hypothetical protein AAVH_42552, partial [Aphelenchoides avenae]
MATIVVRLLLLLSGVPLMNLQILSDVDKEKFNATIDEAKAKFSVAEYFYLDDPSAGDYFDSIVSAARLLKGVFKE